ncbi:hypothetical protein CABS01_03103, partial [Colletotrichum abscissum]|uniref:uncharacterized protein n=1 Tax=Colletotrichum abscissum TaxID=1671311 RepID=UPI0027D4F050
YGHVSFAWLVKDHVYLNPAVDTLFLGTIVDRLGGFRFALASHHWREKVGDLGDFTTSPTLPGYIKKRLRKRMLNRRLDRGENLHPYSSFNIAYPAGPIPLPSLQFPCLEVIHLVSLLRILMPIITHHGLTAWSMSGMGVHFRYVLPTNELYCHRDSTLPSKYFGGIRPNDRISDDHFRVDSNAGFGIRIDIFRDSNLDWVTDA